MLKPTAVVELVWQDETGSNASTLVQALSSATVSEIDASVTALASVLTPLTGCVLIKQRIKYISKPEIRPTASNSTPIVRAGAFYFDCQLDTPDAIITIPSIKDSIILTAEPLAGVGIDTTNADVIAFIETVIGVNATNQFGDAITALIAAYRVSRV